MNEDYYKRPASNDRPKMPPADRAKQFAPFAALKGHAEALRKKEKIIVSKVYLSEERIRILDLKIRQVKKRDVVTVVFLENGEYLKMTGMVAHIDPINRILRIVHKQIPFEHIYDLEGEHIYIED